MCKNNTTTASSDATKTASPELVNSKSHKVYPLSEIKRHNTNDDAWVVVHDKVLDITKFSNTHPGGKDLILLSAGRDATILFETYHPKPVSMAIVNKLQIGVIRKEDSTVTNSFYSWTSDFYPVLRSRVVQRLEELGLSRRGGYGIKVKAAMLLVSFWGSLYQMYVTKSFPVACLWSLFMGCVASFVGTCIQHDGNHGAFSTNSVLNKMAGWTLDMIGASAFTWEFQHMLGHHPYTNLIHTKDEEKKNNGSPALEQMNAESDPDVFSSFPFVRMHPYHEPKWYHKYQHYYTPILFSMMTLLKVFQQDIETIWNNRLYHIDASPRYSNKWNVARFWSMKVLSCIYMIVLPCYFHGVSRGMILFIIGHCACSELLATMFIVNHVIEGVAFAQDQTQEENKKPQDIRGSTPMQSLSTKIPLNDWAAVQCQTSVNWSSGSWFWNHFSGGLSHQIEHHLFPSICHTNYCYIQDVVQKTCEEYGVPYRNERSLGVAYRKMILHLYIMGQGEDFKKID